MPRVLCFHDVTDAIAFRKKLVLLLRLGECINIDEAFGSGARGTSGFIITFDDGCRGVLTNAAQVMAELGVPGILFVVSRLIGGTDPFWWQEVLARFRAGAAPGIDEVPDSPANAVTWLKSQPNATRIKLLHDLRVQTPDLKVNYPHLTIDELHELRAAGIEIGAHSRTHPCLDQCSDAEIADEVVGCRDDLTVMLGEPPRCFAYPNGNVDERVVSAVKAAGYEYAFLFDHRRQKLPVADPHRISRLRVDASMPLAKFAGVVTGILPAIHRLRGRP